MLHSIRNTDGNRVRQVAPDGTSTVYIGQWYEESQSMEVGPVVRTNYYYLGGQRVGLRQGVVGQAGTVYWLHADHLGSTSEVSTATASLSGRERYFPYGQVRYSSGTLPTTYNYTGQRLDGTGLLFYGARYYDPLIGRFTQPDTIVPQPGNPQSLNRYAYVLNNPLRYTDPTGHWFESLIDIISIGYDLYDISQHGLNWENGLSLVADVASLALPVVTGGGMIVRAAAHADDVADVARGVNAAVNVAQAANTAGDIARLGARASDFEKIAHIRGADTLLNKLLAHADDTVKGANFELDFALQHKDEIEEMGKVLEVINGGQKEIDFVLKGNVFVNVKSYDWAVYNPFVLTMETDKMVKQAKDFLKYNPSAIKYVFKGSVPDSVRQALEAAGIIVEVIP